MPGMRALRPQPLLVLIALIFVAHSARAQDNYEIQVYGSDTVPKHDTMVEFHTNFTVEGSKTIQDGVLPSNHAVHETLEITHGFTDWFETGFYVFTSIQPDGGWMWVGDHIRPRVAVPERWRWPIGVSISQEFGYQQRTFSTDTWSYELRPILDKKIGPWYFAFNPAFEKSVHGENVHKGFEFSPAFKLSYDFTKKISGGFEYYGAFGPVTEFDPAHEQQHQFFPSIDLNLAPQWEVNFGVGVGVTGSTDHLIVKGIIGRRFSFGHEKGAKLHTPAPYSAE
jgi:hypothetical protein